MSRRAIAALGPALLGLALLIVAAQPASGEALEVELVIRNSRFSPAAIEVPRGVPVKIVLRNEDPIDHEWIVGTPELHEVHRTGTEQTHEERPTEVTIPALGTRATTIVFEEPGRLTFICHLPGHERYGMVGTLRVRK
jgi:uncharacterized cupredoxin-like copper-binding protein